MTQDRIEREVQIAAPIERVWAVLTEPAHVGEWFGQGKPTDIDLRPGGVMVLDHGEYGTFPTTIVTVEAPHSFSYRWASAYPGEEATEDNSTLVEFTLATADDGTLLRVVETGFAALTIPPARVSTAGYDSHSSGWTEVVQKLRKHAEQSAA
jgi:uncharacterized protein YndB with AHSA1/START domain